MFHMNRRAESLQNKLVNINALAVFVVAVEYTLDFNYKHYKRITCKRHAAASSHFAASRKQPL
jgi:hypothetical protein